jgi:N-acetylglutamate synthase-like GNAT family acetyltransferase
MRIEIRRALPEEADTLTEIAHAAKRHWKYPESWIQQWQTDLTVSAEFIRTHEVFAATINGAIAGCCALVMTDSLAEVEHMWIRPEQMGNGVGRALFEHVRARAVERGANALELSADPNAEGFYERLGAKRIGEVSADMDEQARVLPRMRIEFLT